MSIHIYTYKYMCTHIGFSHYSSDAMGDTLNLMHACTGAPLAPPGVWALRIEPCSRSVGL